MTGRELIIYILENHLEDEDVFKDGKIPGLLTYKEAAVKFGVGVFTIKAWVDCGRLKEIEIYNDKFIPANAELNIEGGNS